MAFIPAPNCTRTDIQFDFEGQQLHNVIWVQWPAPATQTQRENLNTAIRDWWSASGKGGSTAAMTLRQITTVNQDADNDPSSTLIVSPAIAGTAGSSGLPGNVALCATLRTANRGRSYRGRFYWGGLDSSKLLTADTFTTTHVANVVTFLNALRDAITALSAVWVIVSKFHLKLPRTTAVATPINAIAVDQVADSQRRRLPGRGV